MSEILHDLSPERLAGAIEANMLAWLATFAIPDPAAPVDLPGTKRFTIETTKGLMDLIAEAQLEQDQVDSAIQHLMANARKRKVAIDWWVTPSSRPHDLAEHLDKFGFRIGDNEPGMAVDLSKLKHSLTAPEGLSIQLAQDETSWREWSRTMLASNFVDPNTPEFETGVDAWCKKISRSDPETTRHYLGRLYGKPVATSVLFFAGGVAGIYAVATLPEARRKGIGAQLTLQPLHHAREQGYRVGTLTASNLGLSVYRSLGFQDYCRVQEYYRNPD